MTLGPRRRGPFFYEQGMKRILWITILTLIGLAGLLSGMAMVWLHVPFLIVVGIGFAPLIVWAAYETSNLFD